LTELSQALHLAPSTINQHLKELVSVGAIRQIPNEFIVKQKYYEVNPDFRKRRTVEDKRPSLDISSFKIAAGVLVILIIAGLLYQFGGSPVPSTLSATSTSTSQAAPTGATVFSLSDSPTVATVDAVNVTVESVEIRSTTTGKLYTILSTPKSFNLVRLRNISSVLSIANVPIGNYDEFILNVSNVSAVVNGSSASIYLPNHNLRIFGSFNIALNLTGLPAWVNVDIALDKSLHATQNGGLVFLPYMMLSTSDNTNLSVASNGTIVVRRLGHVRSEANVSMDEAGNFTNSSTAIVQAGDSLNVSANGRITIIPSMQSTIAIRSRNKLVLLTNITNAISVVQNLTQQTNTSVRQAVSGIMIPVVPVLKCRYEDRFVDCQTSDNIDVNGTVLPTIGPCPLYCKAGSICQPCSKSRINSTNIASNRTSNYTIVVNKSNPSNLPLKVNSSFASCQTSSECELVPIYPCQNLPQQSACINSSHSIQYFNWYYGIYGKSDANTSTNGAISAAGTGVGISGSTNTTANAGGQAPGFLCPLYLIAYQSRSCGCSDNICTLYVTGYAGTNVTAST